MTKLNQAITKYKNQHPDMSWGEIADKMQISELMLRKYATENTKPRDSTLHLIAGVLQVDPESLKEDAKEEPEKTTVHIVVGKKEEPEEKADRPPLGVKPYDIAAVHRIKDLADAISRNPSDFKKVSEWAEEINWQIFIVNSMVENFGKENT